MAKINQFEDIIAWQKARILTRYVFKKFNKCKNFSYKDQIERASLSIMNNIAEGFERRGDKEFKRFLFIAKGSCGEVRSMLYVAQDMSYTDKQEHNMIYNLTIEISRLLSGFIKSLKWIRHSQTN